MIIGIFHKGAACVEYHWSHFHKPMVQRCESMYSQIAMSGNTFSRRKKKFLLTRTLKQGHYYRRIRHVTSSTPRTRLAIHSTRLTICTSRSSRLSASSTLLSTYITRLSTLIILCLVIFQDQILSIYCLSDFRMCVVMHVIVIQVHGWQKSVGEEWKPVFPMLWKSR